jgi:Holliday junction resolvase RusA-like endonuclease|tara:strand:+ start:171 stop:533 length:363 start_codon:yes stop_codon:yes gene_type:complete
VTDSYTVIIERRPKVKARPRHTKSGKVFTPASTLKEEDHVAQAWKEQVGEKISGPVEVSVIYSPDATILHVTSSPHNAKTLRGDLDNYVKLTLDALNEVAWDDDRQVVRLNASKVDRPTQ